MFRRLLVCNLFKGTCQKALDWVGLEPPPKYTASIHTGTRDSVQRRNTVANN
jgi:hypothetical protein